jgi:hypothetical protein
MSAEKLREFEDMAAKLLATARKLPPGRQNALELIGKYRLQISTLQNQRSEQALRQRK